MQLCPQEFDTLLASMERTRQSRNHEEDEALVRRMKDECNQVLARQAKLAQEQLTTVTGRSVNLGNYGVSRQ